MEDRQIPLYDAIETTPASDLMQLSYEQLDAFIAEAKRIQEDAQSVLDWLVALRSMKASRSYASKQSNGGTNE